MQHIKQNDIQSYDTDNSITFIYDLNDKDIDYCIVELHGRSPANGYAINKECKELIGIISGEGKAIVNNETYNLNNGDAILIDKNEPYYIEGNMRISISCTPAWTEQQHIILDKIVDK